MKNKPIKIFIDIDSVVKSEKSGIGYYSLGLLTALSKFDEVELYAHYFDFLGRSGVILPKIKNVRFRPSKLIHRKLNGQLKRIGLPVPIEILGKGFFDFSIFPNFTSIWSILNTPYTVVVHDIVYKVFPESVSKRNLSFLKRFVPKAVNGAAFITCISNTIAKDLKKFYPNKNRLLVTLIPPSPYLTNKTNNNSLEILKRFKLKPNYLIFIGNNEPRKNISTLIKAYELLDEDTKSKHNLVLVGGAGWKTKRIFDSKYIRNLGYVNDEEKYHLLRNASALIMPSLYEGYGMPLIEAMDLKVPLVVSDIPVFREVTNNNALFFNPNDIFSMSSKIDELINNPKLRQALAENSIDVIRRLSWENVAKDMIKEIQNSLK